MKGWRWLVLILVGAFVLRTWNVNWDSGYHFHPDERWIVMVTEKIEWVNPITNWKVFKSVNSPMNPKFFAYGSLPIYLLRLVGSEVAKFLGDPEWGRYGKINLVGRVVSALFDTGTVLLVFLIARKLFNREKGKQQDSVMKKEDALALGAAGLYCVAVFPIQLSHFYAVDTLLTFFMTLTIYLLLLLMRKRGRIWMWAVGVGVAAGMAMSTKVSGVLLAIPIGTAVVIGNQPALTRVRRGRQSVISKQKLGKWLNVFKWLWPRFKWGLLIALVAGITFVIFEPYAVIDNPTFWKNMQEQGRMTRDAWTFPYTLQYVGTKPYLYFVEQYVKYGVGWGLGLASLLGVVAGCWMLVKGWKLWIPMHAEMSHHFSNDRDDKADLKSLSALSSIRTGPLLVILAFVMGYFGVIGRSAVKFMRYMLPLYPVLCVLAVVGISVISYKLPVLTWRGKSVVGKDLKSRNVFLVICLLVLLLTGGWTMAFMSQVYGQENTRIQASKWMATQLKTQDSKLKIIGIEHWDDALPVPPWTMGFQRAMIGQKEPTWQVELPLYEPDSESKWRLMAGKLEQVDAIVLASNRLSAPLMRIGGEKYGITKRYYELLFGGGLGFDQVADFHVMPGIDGWRVDDQLADESFTVYDHPQVRIFRKRQLMSADDYFSLIMGDRE